MLNKLGKVNWVGSLSGDLAVRPLNNGSLTVDMGQIIDYEAEKAKLSKEKARLEGEIARGEKMLSNERFLSKAPQAKIDEEKAKLEQYRQQYQVVIQQLEEIIRK